MKSKSNVIPGAVDADVDGGAMLMATLGYVLSKLLTASDEDAHELLDRLRHPALVKADQRDQEVSVVGAADIPALLDQVAAGIWQGDHEQGLDDLRSALAAWVSLLESGSLREGAAVADAAARGLSDSDRWDPKALLGLVVAGMITAETGDRPLLGMHSRLKLFCDTGGRFNAALSWLVRRKCPPRPEPASKGLLGVDRPEALAAAVDGLRLGGYHQFPGVMSDEQIEALTRFALQAPGRPEPRTLVPEEFQGEHAGEGRRRRFDEIQGPMAGFWCDQQAVLDQPQVQELLCDPSYLAVAREYFGSEPILATVNLWWSLPVSDQDERESAMAQQFHFDGDWNRNLNFFHYLTDVDAGGGPHTYVRGTHRPGGIPRELLERGSARIAEEEVRACYPAEAVVSAEAPRGTVMAGDTRCLHRGTRPTTHPRLILEFVFADTVISGVPKGQYKVRPAFLADYRRMVAELPDVFRFQTLE